MKLFDNIYGFLFALVGVILQVYAFYYTDAPILSLISGVSGIIAVVLCAERQLSYWPFAWLQLITYLILAVQQKLWGEVGEYVFYGVTMIYGMFVWNKYKDNHKVKSRQLSRTMFQILFTLCVIGITALYFVLDKTNDAQPFIDSVSSVPALFAQFLMILAYKEQWYFWLIIDIASIYMWIVIGDWCMASQFIFWTINCLYGLHKWNVKENY
jgi:nicotinamide mononucleotide transporter